MTAVTNRWAGTGVAPGTVVASSWRADRPVPVSDRPISPTEVERAFRAVAADLEQVAARARAQGRTAVGDIVGVGVLIAGDPDLVDAARRAAARDERRPAQVPVRDERRLADPAQVPVREDPLRAIRDAIEGYAVLLESLPDEILRERSADVRQVGRRVIERLARGGTGISTNPPTRRFVLVAAELGPADLLEHLGQGLVGAVSVRGGANSHAAIVARSVGLPLVTGIAAEILDLSDHTPLLVDADAGVVVTDPPHAEVVRAHAASTRDDQRRAALATERGLPHATADGQPFTLLCNVASDTEVRAGRDAGATGVGLLRTELPFLQAERWPTEADHRRELRPILAEAVGWPVTVRLLDFANDKVPPFLRGHRVGLDALLDHPIALTAQVRAIVQFTRSVPAQIMVPMVCTAAELRTVRAVVGTVVAELGVAPVRVGAMVETLAAVEAVSELCEVADFLSIGTNDLTSQVLDIDRTDPRARPELTADPGVLELIARVVTVAHVAGVPVSVCGDAGSHPTTLPLLLGAGVRAVSVACARIDETRYRLRRLDTTWCAEVFAEALRARDAEEAAALVRDRIEVPLP